VVGGDITLEEWELQDPGNNLLRDYEFRFTSKTYMYVDYIEGTPVTAEFAIFDITDGGEIQITVDIQDSDEGDADGHWDAGEPIVIVNVPYTGSGGFEGEYPDDYAWRVVFSTTDADGVIDPGNVFRIVTNKSLTSADRFQFSTTAQRIDTEQAKKDLELIRVVPNPFVVTSGFDTSRDRHEIHFTRLPATCEIKIFTLAGELVKTINHPQEPGLNFARWDLKTEFGSEVAYGVYLYHLESPAGIKMGKIAIMR
jgi:hypothetical protein